VALTRNLPKTTTEYAEEGTRAHKLAEKCLSNGINPTYRTHQDEDDRLMTEYVQAYIDYVVFHAYGKKLLIEYEADLSGIVPPDGFGTIDAVIMAPFELHVIDLKYGKGVQVYAENNLQLIIYALGIYDNFDFIYDFKTIKMAIHQPRLDHVALWSISSDEIQKYREKIKDMAFLALSENADIIPGEKQCHWCGVKATCRARAEMLRASAKDDFNDFRLLPMNELMSYYRQFDHIKEWISDVEKYVFGQALNGQNISGYKLVEGRSNRVWINVEIAAQKLENLVPQEILWEKKFAGIPAVERYLGKNIGIMKILVAKPQGKPVLVPETDKRQPLIVSAAVDFLNE
jgi:hypothetical protein